jgi:hypothetical protein
MKSLLGGCVICGAPRTERNHVGGQNFVAWFTMPFCVKHHRQFHTLVHAAGINLEYSPDPIVRLIRALKAILVAAFMVLEAMEQHYARSKDDASQDLEEGINQRV